MKLVGVRVIDLSRFLPGPYITQALADHGAEVIKIEEPGTGDPARQIWPWDSASSLFHSVNRGKKSVVLDLKKDGDRGALLDLCDAADVFVENFRPGVVDRFGLSYETLRVRNPRIVYCSISAFGQSGPYRERPAHDLAIEALGGQLSMTFAEDGMPVMPGIPVADIVAGLQGLAGVLMALVRRETTGKGDYLDISMQDSLLAALPANLGLTSGERRSSSACYERMAKDSAFHRIYETRDGRHIVLSGREIKNARALLGALGRPDFVPLCERGPGPHQQPLIAFLRETFLQKTRDEWNVWLGQLNIGYGIVNTVPEALADTQALARGTVCQDRLGRRYVPSPIRFREEPAQQVGDVPELGAHNREVLGPGRFCAWT